TWVTEDGSGFPLLLLHGAFHGSEALLPVFGSLGKHARLLAYDRAGHGRTADRVGAFDYASMVAQTIAVLDSLDVASADLVGYSDGGIVAMRTAIEHPERVRSMVVIGAHLHGSGQPFELDEHSAATAAMRKAYGALSPDGPEHFDIIAAQHAAMFASGPGLDL